MKNLRLLAILIILFKNCESQFSCNPLIDCLNAEKSGNFVPDPDDCEKYYICVTQSPDNHLGPTPEPLKCPDGTYFNHDTSNCMTEYGTCINRCPPAIYRCQAQCPLIFETLTSAANNTDCSYFTLCQNGTQSSLRCPADSPYFNGTSCVTDVAQCCEFCTPFCTQIDIQMQDPCNCTFFYTCNEVGPVTEDTLSAPCGPGQYFDNIEESCVNGICGNTCPSCAKKSTTTDFTTMTKTTTEFLCTAYCTGVGAQIQNPCNCTSFYICSEQGPVPDGAASIQCPPGLYFDEDAEKCSEGSCNNTCPYCGETDTTVAETTIDSTYSTDPETTTEFLCTAYCTGVGAQIQNPCNCTSFYICSEPGPVPDGAASIQCPPGLYFDEDAEICSEGSCNNTCPYCGETDTTVAETTIDSTYSTEPETTTEFLCTAYCTGVGAQIQNPCNCTSFYICSEPGPVPDGAASIQCPPGLYFDEDAEICSEGSCNNTCPYCGETDTTVAETTIDSTYSTELETTTEFLCTAYCTDVGAQIQNPCNCTSFYICSEPGPVPDGAASIQCPPGLYFDEDAEICSEGSCNNTCPYCGETDTTVAETTIDSTYSTEPETTTEFLCTAYCTGVGAQIQNPCNCTSFYICSEPGPVPDGAASIQCPPGLYFDEDAEICSEGSCNNTCPYCGETDTTVAETTTDSTYSTEPETITEFRCTAYCTDVGAQIQNPCNCTSLYFCLELGPVPEDSVSFQCPPGQYFDEDDGICSEGSCNNTCPYCGETDTSVAETTTDSIYSTEPETITEFLCTAYCTAVGLHIENPCNCSSFFICSELGPVPDDAVSFQYSPGQYFDEATEIYIDGACHNACQFC